MDTSTSRVYANATLGDVRIAEVGYLPECSQSRHSHAYCNVSLLLSGALEESVGERRTYARPLNLVVKPAGTEHTDRFGTTGARTLTICLEPSFTAPLHDWGSALGGWRWQYGGEAVPSLLGLLAALREPRPVAHDELRTRVYDVVASLVREEPPPPDRRLPGWLVSAKQELDDTFASGARVRDVAARAGVHPVYLARQFRRYLGCSVTDYLQRLRMQSAATLLGSSDCTVAAAAHRAGFADQSHLSRVFKAQTGFTPLLFRRLVRDQPVARPVVSSVQYGSGELR